MEGQLYFRKIQTQQSNKTDNLSCARFECNNQIKGQLKLRKIQTKQSNERKVKSKKIQMKEKV